MCDKCNNTGYIDWTENINGIDYDYTKPCDCLSEERTADLQAKYIETSGLVEVLERLTFDSYIAGNDAQQYVKDRAIKYAKELNGWWYISSKPGTGKTHITTAICADLIKRGVPVHYMEWRQEATELKGLITDSKAYNERLRRLETIKVLYIDDFFKGTVSEADKNLAFTIINHRYNKDLVTLFSSERSIQDLVRIDEAIAGRIKERAGDMVLNLGSLADRRLL